MLIVRMPAGNCPGLPTTPKLSMCMQHIIRNYSNQLAKYLVVWHAHDLE
jgi:hypothetical protein